MGFPPNGFDIWLAKELASFLEISTYFNNVVQRAVYFGLLGSLWFAAALFIFWIQSARKGRLDIQLRILSTMAGSAIAISLTIVAGYLFTRPPPARLPELHAAYLYYYGLNPSTNCFPSQSVALYAVVAAGVYSIHRILGWVLWVMVLGFVALPRMYMGGHYLTDVLAGLALAAVGYLSARHLLEKEWIAKARDFSMRSEELQWVREFLVFLWILEVALEFRDVQFVKYLMESNH